VVIIDEQALAGRLADAAAAAYIRGSGLQQPDLKLGDRRDGYRAPSRSTGRVDSP